MNAIALLNAFKNRLFISNRTISDNFIVFDNKILFRICFVLFLWRILFKTSLLIINKSLCFTSRLFLLIKKASIFLLKLKNCIWNKIKLATDETTFDLCETVYERVIDVATSAHGMRSESYYVGLHFLEALNRKVLWREFWEWKLCNVKVR